MCILMHYIYIISLYLPYVRSRLYNENTVKKYVLMLSFYERCAVHYEPHENFANIIVRVQ